MATAVRCNLRDSSLPNILSTLNRERATGTLKVTNPNFTKKVYLVKGDAIFSASTYEDDRLGDMLLKAGRITVDQYDEAVRIMKETRKRLGAVLVELGYLAPKDLFWGVKYQVKEIILSLFHLEEGECEFIEGDVPSDEVITLKMSMGNLIYEGVKRIDNLTRIKKDMPGKEVVLRLSNDPASLFQDVELSPEDIKILPMVDGQKTIKEIIEGSWMNTFEVMKTLYVLCSLGILEEKSAGPKQAKKPAEEEEGMISLEDILHPFAQEEEEFIQKVEQIYSNLETMEFHELLEVDENADPETIKKNYYKLSRDFHPDRSFSSPDTGLKDKLTAIFDRLASAYSALRDSANKTGDGMDSFSTHFASTRDYHSDIGEGAHPAEDAEKKFRQGTEELKAENFEEAAELFTEAAKINPNEPQYWSYLSIAMSKIPNKLKEAEDALLQAIKLEPLNGEHYANLGDLLLKNGLNKRAASQFEKALKFDRGNVKAQKGLKKIKEL